MVIVFDVDGTVLDTYAHVRASYIEVFKKMLPDFKYTEELLKSFFGPPLPDTFMKIVNDEELTKLLVEEFFRVSRLNVKEYLKVFPKTFETLAQLKRQGYILTVASNKSKKSILEGFEVVGLNGYFDFIIGYDSVQNPKPHPEGIKIIENHFQDQCILVGDTGYDILTAKNAHIKSVGVTWALTSREELIKAGADYVIDDFEELLEIVKEL
jgi:phosphoglycolate phosphatase